MLISRSVKPRYEYRQEQARDRDLQAQRIAAQVAIVIHLAALQVIQHRALAPAAQHLEDQVTASSA
jgi:hypothetical protein